MIKKIISFSLWGNNPKYTIGAIRNAELAKEIYPDWICRFYVGEDVADEIKTSLLDLNSEIVEMGGSDWNGMFWRFFAADSDDIVISRDTDSRLGQREKAAVDEWLASDKDFHIMRDHPYHATAILGGMWGCRNGILKGIKQMIHNYDVREFNNKYQVDQNFLREVIYPIVWDESIVHDEFFYHCPFPKNAPERTKSYFVGQVYDENEITQF
jgi:hypothetical protein